MFLRDPKFQHNTWLVAHANSPLERFLLVPKGCVSSMLQPQLSMWSALPSGGLKINVDVPVTEDLPYFRVGVVARDNIRVVLSAMAWRLPGKFSPHILLKYMRYELVFNCSSVSLGLLDIGI